MSFFKSLGALSRKVSKNRGPLQSGKTGHGKSEQNYFWGRCFWRIFLKKRIKRVTLTRFWNRNTFYWILGVPVVEKWTSGRCRMWVLHTNNSVEWRSAFFLRNRKIDGPRCGKVTLGSHFGGPGDTQTWKKLVLWRLFFSVDFSESTRGGEAIWGHAGKRPVVP